MPKQSEFDKFWVNCSKILDTLQASIQRRDAEPFIRSMYDDFLRINPKNKSEWIKDFFIATFKSMKEPPKWIGEPTWPFFDGEPMIFMNQFTIPITAQHLNIPLSDTVYVFACNGKKTDPSSSTVFKLVIQDEEGCEIHPTSDGIIKF